MGGGLPPASVTMPPDIMEDTILGLRERSVLPCPRLPFSPLPHVKTSPEVARARLWPSPPTELASWLMEKPGKKSV